MKKQKAIEKLQQQIDFIESLKSKARFSPEYKRWLRDTEVAIEHIFGKEGRHLGDFKSIRFQLGVYASNTPDYKFEAVFRSGLDNAGEILKSMIYEIKEYGMVQNESLSRIESVATPVLSDSTKVFVVHGHDEAAKQAVARFIEKLDLTPVILHEQPNEGRTIIEKFEDHSDVCFAVVLMTPDDIGALAEEEDKLKPRARQNVILEFGFFLGKLGRKRVCALYKDVEIPSDYKGVLFIPMDKNNGWQLSLAKEIKAVGIEIDLNKVM